MRVLFAFTITVLACGCATYGVAPAYKPWAGLAKVPAGSLQSFAEQTFRTMPEETWVQFGNLPYAVYKEFDEYCLAEYPVTVEKVSSTRIEFAGTPDEVARQLVEIAHGIRVQNTLAKDQLTNALSSAAAQFNAQPSPASRPASVGGGAVVGLGLQGTQNVNRQIQQEHQVDGYGATSGVTGRPKTEYVHGYTRANGTYVAPYYRSKARR